MNANPPGKLGAIDQAAMAAIEQAAALHKATTVAAEIEGELRAVATTSENLASLLQRVTHAAIEEIEAVIAELMDLRERLREEDQRVRREIGGYADKSQAAMASMAVITDSLAKLRQPPPPGARYDFPIPMIEAAPAPPESGHEASTIEAAPAPPEAGHGAPPIEAAPAPAETAYEAPPIDAPPAPPHED